MQRIQQAERQGDVIGDLDGRERFASAGFRLSETSSDVSHLGGGGGGVGVGWGSGGGRVCSSGPLPEGTKVDSWRRRSGLFSEWRADVMTRGSDSFRWLRGRIIYAGVPISQSCQISARCVCHL